MGVFASTFLVANQPEVIEHVWRNLVHTKQLVNYRNIFRGREILDLEYLTNVFQSNGSKLDTKRLFESSTKVTYVLTDYNTGEPTYHYPAKEDLFKLMEASCALPFFSSPRGINGSRYIDGSITQPIPLQRALSQNPDEVFVVYNKPEGMYVDSSYNKWKKRARLALKTGIMRKTLVKIIEDFEQRVIETEEILKKDPRIKVLRPKKSLSLKSILDTDKIRLNQTFNQGVIETYEYLQSWRI